MSTKLQAVLGGGVLVIFVALFFYVQGLQREIEALRLEKQTTEQNRQAAVDLANARFAQITELTAFVDSLNDRIVALNRERVALRARISLLADTLEFMDSTATALVNAQRDSVTIPLHSSQNVNPGKPSFVYYEGWASANLKNETARHYLRMYFSTIEVQHELFRYPEDGLWKLRTISATPGIKVAGYATLDASLLRNLQSSLTPREEPMLGFGALVGYKRLELGAGVRALPKWFFGGFYNIVNPYSQWYQNIAAGAFFFP